MPQLSDLGAADELLAFKDEGEHRKSSTGAAAAAAERDLDDVKSSLVHESETKNRSAAAAQASGTDAAGQGLAEAAPRRRTAGEGLLQPPAYVSYPFWMIPDLCGSYLATGALAYLPWQWPLLDVPGRDTPMPAHLASGAPAHLAQLHPLLSYRAKVGAEANSAHYGGARMAHAFHWLQGHGVHPMAAAAGFLSASMSGSPAGPPSASPTSVPAVAIKREAAEVKERGPLRTAPDGGERRVKGHIKKPLNAFMLFMRDERPKVVARCQVKESAAINQILGHTWHRLSKDEQAKYYELARKERLLHSQLYPGWSARDNYGKKKKRKKCKSLPENAGTDHADSPLPPKRRPVSHLTHLSQASPASSLDSPATPTTALASPAAPAPTRSLDPPTPSLDPPPSSCRASNRL